MINKVCLHTLDYTDYEQLSRACLYRNSSARVEKSASRRTDYTTPWSSMASATFTKPAMFAPTTRLPGCPVLFRSVPCVFEDRRHDVSQPRIDLLPRPRQTHGVLAHLETGGGNASRICGFAGAEQNFFLHEQIDRCRHARHVGRFRHKVTTVVGQFLCVFGCDLVLRRTRKSAIAFYAPRPLAGHIFGAAEFFAYSLMRPRRTFLMLITKASFSSAMPFLS